jgi:hypothetical protein
VKLLCMVFCATLDFHFEWVVLQVDVVNSFNIDFHRVIFQKLNKRSIVSDHPFHPLLLCPIALSFI